MADKPNIIRTFSARWIDRIMRVVEYVEMNLIGASSNRHRRTPIGGGSDGTNGIGNGGGGGGCCCSEGTCLKPIPGLDTPVIPPFRLVPVTAFCGCTGGRTDGELRMYPVDPESTSVWETPHGDTDKPNEVVSCSYPDCTATRQWLWDGTTWQPGAITGGSCGEPLKPDWGGVEVGDDAETDFRPTLQDAWWQETITGKDANGCDQSVLKFCIGNCDDVEEE